MRIVNKSRALPQATLIYSPPGVGKTEFAAHYPKPIFIMVDLEIGLLTLIKTGRVPEDTGHLESPVYTFEELINAVDFVADTQHDYQTLVIDTANSAEMLCKRKITKEQFWGREDKFDAFAKGWERCATPWNMFLHRLNSVRARGMRVVLLAHSEVSQTKNPDGEDYQSHTPIINKKALWVPTNAWCDNVLFMNLEVCTVTDKNQQAVKDKNHRLLYVQSDAGHYAKNRFGLDRPLSMGTCGREGFLSFQAAVEEASKTRLHKSKDQPQTKDEQPKKEEPKQEEPPPADAQAGPVWVHTWRNRIKAAGKIGPAVSTFTDLAADYATAPEPDQLQHFPGLFLFWVDHCLSLGGKAAEHVEKKLGGKSELPIQMLEPLLARLGGTKAA